MASAVDNSFSAAQSVEEPRQCRHERLHLEVISQAISRGGFADDGMQLTPYQKPYTVSSGEILLSIRYKYVRILFVLKRSSGKRK
jgi:hypothetical protein